MYLRESKLTLWFNVFYFFHYMREYRVCSCDCFLAQGSLVNSRFVGWWMLVAKDEVFCFSWLPLKSKSPDCSFIPSILERERTVSPSIAFIVGVTVLVHGGHLSPCKHLSGYQFPWTDKACLPDVIDYYLFLLPLSLIPWSWTPYPQFPLKMLQNNFIHEAIVEETSEFHICLYSRQSA